MTLPQQARLLRIYIGEKDHHKGKPLYAWIVQQAREQKLAGATVLRGMEGFGAHRIIHHSQLLTLSDDLPVVVEIVDTLEKIEAFLPVIEPAISEGLVTLEKVEVRLHKLREPAKRDTSGFECC